MKGEVRSIPGSINRILTARSEGITRIIITFYNLLEGDGIENIQIYGVKTLVETIELLQSKKPWPDQDRTIAEYNMPPPPIRDISTIIGQPLGVRAVQIAAAGKHNLMMIGSPGCGKSSLADVMPGLLPGPR